MYRNFVHHPVSQAQIQKLLASERRMGVSNSRKYRATRSRLGAQTEHAQRSTQSDSTRSAFQTAVASMGRPRTGITRSDPGRCLHHATARAVSPKDHITTRPQNTYRCKTHSPTSEFNQKVFVHLHGLDSAERRSAALNTSSTNWTGHIQSLKSHIQSKAFCIRAQKTK